MKKNFHTPNGIRSIAHLPWTLVIDANAWRAAYRAMIREQHSWAVGELDIHVTETARELIVRKLRTETRLAAVGKADSLPAQFVMGILPVDGHSGRAAIVKFVAQLPQAYQRFTTPFFVEKENRGHWTAALIRFGQIEPIEEVQFVGPKPFKLSARDWGMKEPNRISLARSSRFRRAVGEEVWKKLRNSTVTLVGAGRNGWRIAFELAGMGIERLRIVDFDTLQWENIDLMPAAHVRDIERNKAMALMDALNEFQPGLAVSVNERSVRHADAIRFLEQRSDLLVTAVDSDLARLAVSRVANRTLTVHLDISTDVQQGENGVLISGDARLLLPGRGCVACVGEMPELVTRLRELNAPPGSLPLQRPLSWDEQRLGSLGTINAITCGAASQLWLDFLAGHKQTSWWQRLLWQPSGGLVSDSGPIGPGNGCPICQ